MILTQEQKPVDAAHANIHACPMKPIPKATALKAQVQSVLATLKRLGNPRFRAEMEPRYGIVTKDAFGVRMNEMQSVAKQLGRHHALALALWKTGNYEARTVAAFVAEPERVTPALMDRWCRDFDNWAICDTVCFKLFDQLPHAFGRVEAWAKRKDEFQKRAAFALLASLALHDEDAEDQVFKDLLPLIEAAATDERNFVKKGVSWALRAIGGRSVKLHAEVVEAAQQLKASPDSSARWIGSDVLRDITRPAVARRLARSKK
jgi:3-methyladenine DNA glycosylase AlkD